MLKKKKSLGLWWKQATNRKDIEVSYRTQGQEVLLPEPENKKVRTKVMCSFSLRVHELSSLLLSFSAFL